MNRHWNEDDFLNKLYEIGPEDGHLRECPSCTAQWEVWLASRRQVLQPPAVPPDLLGRQRQLISQSLNTRRYPQWSSALALAGIALLAVVWKIETRPATKTDAQLMTEIYQTVYASEPAAVAPIRGLFETAATERKR